MDIKQLAKDHIKDSYVMQLATSRDGQPWVCNVHFLADDDLNLYWLSAPDCRHSQEIADNPHVAAGFAVNIDMPLIGVQIEGSAKRVEFDEHEAVLQAYADRHNRKDFVQSAVEGKSTARLYKLTSRVVQIFDLKNFAHAPKQQWRA